MTTSSHEATGDRRLTGTRPAPRSRVADATPTVGPFAIEGGRHGAATLERTMTPR